MSHTGKVRPNNEDHDMVLRLRRSLSVLTTNLPEGEYAPRGDEDAHAMIVADGMGGAASGEVASRQAIRVAMERILRDIKWTMKFNEREEAELVEQLGIYFHLMDHPLLESSRAEPRLAGMGTILTAVCTAGPVAFVVHTGNSRAYLHRGGTEAPIKLSCRWVEGGNFLVREVTVTREGKPVMSISRRIGWDPLARQIRSWEFDSAGGSGEGRWRVS